MRVILAPDKFKGTASAAEVARALETGLKSVRPDLDVVTVPIADGGEGTVLAAMAAGFGRVDVIATGPTGERVTAPYAGRAGTAVVELAAICGSSRLPGGPPDPLGASSYGLGEVVLAAVAAGCTKVIVGLGGSASTDGGVGFLQATGARVVDSGGHPVARGGRGLADIASLNLSTSGLSGQPVELVVAADVQAPLYGESGAAQLFAPQKGASPAMVAQLEAGLRHWADVALRTTGVDHSTAPGAGAAGGVGFGALLVGARIVGGVEILLELAGFAETVVGADLVITGEGSLDAQSLAGKAPVGVAAAAARAGVRTVAVVGRSSVSARALASVGIAEVYSLAEIAGTAEQAMADTAGLLERVGARLARSLFTVVDGESARLHRSDPG